MTQEALAEELGCAVQYLRRIEAGDENMTVRTMVRLANELRCSVMSLFEQPRTRAVRRGRPRKVDALFTKR